MRANLLPAFLPLVLLSCAGARQEAPPPPAEPPAPPPLPAYATEVLASLDAQADPCQDFYRYACGGWIDATPLPSDKPIWARSFSVIRDRNRAAMKEVLDEAAADPAAGDADWARMGAFYGACMDEAALDAAGVAPLQPTFAEIDAVKDVAGAMKMAGKLQALGAGAFVTAAVYADFKDPNLNILHVSQGGLGLPDRDYYLRDDEASATLMAAYEAHVAEMLAFTGLSSADAAKRAKAVVALEKAIAEASWPKADLRDPVKVYNKLDRAGLKKLTPKLAWDGWLEGAMAADVQHINVEVPDVYQKLEKLLVKTDAGTLRAYLKWQLVHALAPQLGKPIYDAHFAFMSQKVLGQKEPEARWKRCVNATDHAMGEILGRYFVETHFAGESKQVASSMIDGINGAFEEGLPTLAWMDDETRARAKEKADKLRHKIGYPDAWRDYAALEAQPGKHVENHVAAARFEHARNMAKIGRPVDRNEWYMSPPAVNAYYDPTQNEMVFPAGILQPPFFSKDFPSAMNYGAIGMVMGHELTHGFDDQGRKFDGDGMMQEWWNAEVAARFDERAACVKEQYDGYSVGEGLNVNGALTLGENIADLGGVREAYRAWRRQQPAEAQPAIPGLTDEQLFFVAYAQGWCTVASPEWEKMLVLSNPHSPSKFRVNGPLSNLPEFHAAFSCEAGTAMRPETGCEVW